MSTSIYLANKILDEVYGAVDFTPPATVYVSLHTGAPGGTGANETSGTGYARIAVTNNATNFPAASGAAKSNGTLFQFATPGAGGWGTVTHVGTWDASTAGNHLNGGALAISKTINEGDDVEIPIGDIDFTMS